MTRTLTFTLDLEDHRPDERLPKRYPAIMDEILEFLGERKIKATIFTVGALAEQDPAIVRRAHELGHEIAHHSYDHTVITNQTPAQFREHTKRGKGILEDITGTKVSGYRAPVFSLTRKTIWAVDILKDLGFDYSSSVLPAANPQHGFPGLPSALFRWENGLLEIPVPVGNIGPLRLPYLGGFYFRYLPFNIVRSQAEKAGNDNVLWTYCHPYDFDAEEKNWRIKGASIPVSLLLWFNRKNTFKKLGALAAEVNFSVPFRDQDFGANLPVINPATL